MIDKQFVFQIFYYNWYALNCIEIIAIMIIRNAIIKLLKCNCLLVRAIKYLTFNKIWMFFLLNT